MVLNVVKIDSDLFRLMDIKMMITYLELDISKILIVVNLVMI